MPVVTKAEAGSLTAILEPDDSGFIGLCPELDIVGEGSTRAAAFDDLLDLVLEYAEEFRDEPDVYGADPRRAGHWPLLEAALEAPDRDTLRALFL